MSNRQRISAFCGGTVVLQSCLQAWREIALKVRTIRAASPGPIFWSRVVSDKVLKNASIALIRSKELLPAARQLNRAHQRLRLVEALLVFAFRDRVGHNARARLDIRSSALHQHGANGDT